MFDSNGKLPFLQEGVLLDAFDADFCDFYPNLPGFPGPDICKALVSEENRYFLIPYGTANGPGSENQCKHLPKAKYCQNYFMPIYTKDNAEIPKPEPRKFNFQHFRDPKIFRNSLENLAFNFQRMPGLSTTDYDTDNEYMPNLSDDIDPNSLIKLSDFIIEKNSYVRKVYSSLSEILKNQTSSEQFRSYVNTNDIEDDILGAIANTTASIMIFMWWQVNGLSNGPGMWGYQPPLAYQGMCYPQDCSAEEIEINNRIFASYLFKYNPLMPTIVPTPRISDDLFGGVPEDPEDLKGLRWTQNTAIGCSDDERYNGKWKAENYAVVILFSIIGFFISVGTLMELLERAPYIKKSQLDDGKSTHGLGYRILTSFSLISNMEFIFKSPKKGGGQRLDCLEGMRAISMTWVILGHSFVFGVQLITYRNKDYINRIWSKEVGGQALEAIKQGEFSVDSFLFIGATLLSFLLLKDLDKSNGWFHGKGIVRMILFYINRYLRISIPFALVLLVYIGLLPIMLTNPMRVHSWTVIEAGCCKEYWWRKLTYSALFGATYDCCLGQTWYLMFDMIWFCLSPLIVYPLWRTKFGTFNQIVGISWWCLAMLTSISATGWYAFNMDLWDSISEKNDLPTWSFSPWGDRSMCYLIGLMTGYILHVSKDKKIKIHWLMNIIIWLLVALIALACVYSVWSIDTYEKYRPYLVFRKFGWGLSLSWITFSCVKGYGGIINDFLSWGLWTPISKISFMTYLFHMSFNYYYYLEQGYNVDVSFWLFTEIFVSQLIVCLFYGIIGCLTLELPYGKIQKLLISQLVGGK